jgi:hypothetical protein
MPRTYDPHKKLQVVWGDDIVTLHFEVLDLDMDMDDLTTIHYDNIVGEMITVPVLLNRVGLIRADIEHQAKRAKMDVEIKESDLAAYYKDKLKIMSADKVKYPTIPEVSAAIAKDPALVNLKKIQINKERDFSYADSLYWAVKDKSQKVGSLYHKITPEGHEHEIMEGTLNGMKIKSHKPLLK